MKRAPFSLPKKTSTGSEAQAWIPSYQYLIKGSQMIYVGMDVGSKSFVIHAVNDKRELVFKGEIRPTKTGRRKLVKDLDKETKLVVFEAGNQLEVH